MSVAAEVYGACRISDALFAMNPYLTQQNFYSQQLRALALVGVVNDLHLKAGRRNVCVVGAGVAGRTLAAAFVSVGASVSLIEARDRPFERYMRATHRELHPNIIFWPDQEPMPATALPFMNWAQSSAKQVVEDLFAEWEEGFGKTVNIVSGEVVRINHGPDGVVLSLRDNGTHRADICVLATGFKEERPHGALSSPGYWSPSSVGDECRNVLVSGSGDGGLIDVLSPVLGTDVNRAAQLLAVLLRDSPLKEDVAKVEADRRSKLIPGSRDSSDLCGFYERVHMPADISQRIDAMAVSADRLSGRSITLVFTSTSAYSFTAAPINKLLLSHFCNAPKPVVTTIRGKLEETGEISAIEPVNGTGEVRGLAGKFDRILVRHGADAGVVDILAPAEVEALKIQAAKCAGAAGIVGYDRALFTWKSKRMGRSAVQLQVARRVVDRMLERVGRAYGITIKLKTVPDGWFTDEKPIEVTLVDCTP